MRLEWDDAKNRAKDRKHGFRFAEAAEMFAGVLLVLPDLREDYGELRWIGTGMIRGGLVFVAFAEQPDGVIRIISLRKATREEEKKYKAAVQDGLGTD
jgi:uncharacterized DUF497 family protein